MKTIQHFVLNNIQNVCRGFSELFFAVIFFNINATANPIVQISPGGPLNFCLGDSVTLCADVCSGCTAPYTFNWKKDTDTTVIAFSSCLKVKTSGSYCVTVTCGKGCRVTRCVTVTVDSCSRIRGFLYDNFQCGGSPVEGDTIVIVDVNMNILNSISPAVTASDGSFKFMDNQVLALDTNARFGFATKSGFALEDTTTQTIDNWINQSPLSLTLVNVTQQWAQKFNNTDSLDAGVTAIDIYGNVYVAGYIRDAVSGFTDYIILKYNRDGILKWSRQYDGPGHFMDIPYAIIVDTQGNVYVTGNASVIYTPSMLEMDLTTIKLDSSGNINWVVNYQRGYPGNGNINGGRSVITDNKGNVYVTGFSANGTPQFNYDLTTLKYNSQGVLQWAANYDDSLHRDDTGISIATDTLGYIYVTGISDYNGASANSEIVTVKYDSLGNTVRTLRYKDNNHSQFLATDMIIDGSMDIFVCGSAWSSAGSYDYITIKYNAQGILQWVNTYNGTGNSTDWATSLVADKTGNIYVTGYSEGVQNQDIITISYDGTGTERWVVRFNGASNGEDWANAIGIDTSGNIYVTGASQVNGDNFDYTTIKYNNMGGQEWVMQYNDSLNGYDESTSIAISPSGNVYVSGASFGGGITQNEYDISTVKYAQCTVTANDLRLGNPKQKQAPQETTARENNVKVYPNPNNGAMQVDYSLADNQKATFEVYDITGRKVLSYPMKEGKNILTISESNIENGVYLYQVVAGNQRITEGKLVIIKYQEREH